MKKGIIIIVGVVLVLALIFYFDSRGSKSATKAMEATTAAGPVVAVVPNDLPLLPLTRLDGSRVVAKDLKGRIVLVLFQPDCGHCQREAVEIRENLEAFDGYILYFISDAALPQLSKFAEEYELAGVSNIYFAQTTVNDIIQTLGPVEAPSVFVYSEEGRLVNSFIGETPIEQITSSL